MNMSIKERDEKLWEEESKYKHKCKCGHTVTIYPFERRERKICSYCGYYVYADKRKQDRYDFMLKMNKILRRGK